MNRSRKMRSIIPSLLLSQCVDGFIMYKTAECLSVRTVSSYEWTLKKWLEHFEDRPICQVTSDDIRDYLAYLRTEYHPQPRAKKEQERVSKGEKNAPKLATKTVRNFWIVLKSFFTWAAKVLKISNPMADVQGPKYKTGRVRWIKCGCNSLPLGTQSSFPEVIGDDDCIEKIHEARNLK